MAKSEKNPDPYRNPGKRNPEEGDKISGWEVFQWDHYPEMKELDVAQLIKPIPRGSGQFYILDIHGLDEPHRWEVNVEIETPPFVDRKSVTALSLSANALEPAVRKAIAWFEKGGINKRGNPSKADLDTSHWDAYKLIKECQKLWESYCEKPGITRLRAVTKHCEAMKASRAKSVKQERVRCMRSVRAEAKSRGWKL